MSQDVCKTIIAALAIAKGWLSDDLQWMIGKEPAGNSQAIQMRSPLLVG